MIQQINIKEGYLTIIHEASKILSKRNSLNEALKEILKILYSYWDAPVSFVALFDDQTGTLKITESFGMTKKEVSKGVFKKEEGAVGGIFKNELPAVIYDIENNPKYINKTRLIKRFGGNLVFLGVPIKVGGEKFGVLCAYKEKSRTFSYDDAIKMLSTLATLIGLTKKMYERMEEERKFWQEEKEILISTIGSDAIALKDIIGVSDVIANIKKVLLKIASTDSTVFITGESGTGKTLIARTIHKLSARKDKPFATINCAAIPENLLESELFGYERGAFSGAVSRKRGKFELANGGTLFLDEIGDMPLALQAKLLNVLQDKEISRLGSEQTIPIDVRIIAATNKDIEKLLSLGYFREDLYYRLNVIPIHIPPLRERKEDIPILIDYFLKKFNRQYKKRLSITADAVKLMVNYRWGGNIRELENTIERLVIMNDSDIDVSDLPSYIKDNFDIDEPVEHIEAPLGDMPSAIEAIEKQKIQDALKKAGYVKSKAARLLGYTIRQLDYRIKKYNIKVYKL
ncbi:sigma-54-dependent Fis family transcriptional regulator [Hippea jasoniae]|uniref:sigma-54-dependent Fis family transcriptional regulator n=1 Tax=Hippea jasoniae TaxID=944479 RepID=UPI00054EE2C2|nr:sigma 54-interacting transcriptional regulator [Hippea jasoniae]